MFVAATGLGIPVDQGNSRAQIRNAASCQPASRRIEASRLRRLIFVGHSSPESRRQVKKRLPSPFPQLAFKRAYGEFLKVVPTDKRACAVQLPDGRVLVGIIDPDDYVGDDWTFLQVVHPGDIVNLA
jgi:hypothetical protein